MDSSATNTAHRAFRTTVVMQAAFVSHQERNTPCRELLKAKTAGLNGWLTVKRHPNGITESEIARFTGIQRRTVNNHLNELRDDSKIDKEEPCGLP